MLALHTLVSHTCTVTHHGTIGMSSDIKARLVMLWDCEHVTLSQQGRGEQEQEEKREIEAERERESRGLVSDAWHVALG